MTYRSPYRRRSSVPIKVIGTAGLIVSILGVFAASVYFFRTSSDVVASPVDSIADVLVPTPMAIPTATDSREAVLHDLTGSGATATATRGTKDGHFYHTIKASLPGIDRASQMYEAWLVRPVPYDYFSTGEMVTNEAGEFVLEFNGDPAGEYSGYTQVVITREAKDANPDPAIHILEGEFD